MKVSAYRISIGMMFLNAAIEYMQTARDWILGALPRCQNCGWIMDETVCPKCGYVQQ